ncbi:MAG: glycosyltransferase [Syntrophothermus sp.]|uniref:glycosyltransferase family 4 protein n=1 Tax=Syntrophothermus sp. TaxID=2736299 RepID=UPI00257CBC2B|nr:glycosyltransferase family 4 protein [Syntrophothermus sp.]NSW83769.1 glycosyltransferase [Syntrophothermus sp.]
MSLINLGTYPPKQCGIASFSKDLRDNLIAAGEEVKVIAVSDSAYSYVYPPEVVYKIRQERKLDYIDAAKLVNYNPEIKAVLIQHEYGIFGGSDGEYVLKFTFHLRKPYILVTHTVLPRPSATQRSILSRLGQKAAAVVCMTRRSANWLTRVYGIAPEKIAVIHHGVPVFEEKDRGELKKKYGLEGRRVITTFGLIGPGKGLENGLLALARVINRHPDVLYLIAGGTHPMLLKREGDRYRQMLVRMVADLGLENHVKFVNRFLELDELGDYLYMTDLYLSPYPNRDQAVSGTLSYAVGCGRAVVATPYEHALEMLSDGKGLVCKEINPEEIADLMDRVLSDEELRRDMEAKTREFGKTIEWPRIGEQYVRLANQIAGAGQGVADGERVGHGL